MIGRCGRLVITPTRMLGLLAGWAQAHQDPCHRRHSCPSDQGA
jgi:hypothetical protein